MYSDFINTGSCKDAASRKDTKVFFQPRYAVNKPGDIYEQEADAVAEKVVRNESVNLPETFFKPGTLRFPFLNIFGADQPNPYARKKKIQRKCKDCEEEEKVLRKDSGSGETTADRKFESYVDNLNSRGNRLSRETRSYFEPGFGYDFSNVKIHNDSVAVKSAQSINALAYTSGNNIVFNSGQYDPATEPGKRLLAHELTHVVQQNGPERIGRRIALPGESSDLSKFRPGKTASNPACTFDQFNTAYDGIEKARAWTLKSINSLTSFVNGSADEGIKSSLERNFHSADPSTAKRVLKMLKVISRQLNQSSRFTINCRNTPDVRCNIPIAFVQPGFDEINLCPRFWSLDGREIPEVLIHEFAHTSPDISVTDYSYVFTRYYRFQTTNEALLNADSYSTFCFEIANGITHPTPPVEDDIAGCTKEQKELLEYVFSKIEIYNIRFANILNMNREVGGMWENTVLISQLDLATHFDNRILARKATKEIYHKMRKTKLPIECKAAGEGRIGISEGKNIYVYPDFFKIHPDDAVADMYAGLLMTWGELKEYWWAKMLALVFEIVTKYYYKKPEQSEVDKIDFL